MTENGNLPAVDDPCGDFPESLSNDDVIEFVHTEAVELTHPLDPGPFARHEGVPAHDQDLLKGSRIAIAGAGGLGGWIAVALARSGAGTITVIDPDLIETSNLSRQFFTAADRGKPKGPRLARNLADQAPGGINVTGIGLSFDEAIQKYTIPADLIIAGVDNNECRMQILLEARKRRIPAIFSMLSRDGMRCHVFLQNASPFEPCIWCALPNLDVRRSMPCASAIVSSCFLTASLTVFFAHRALTGWGDLVPFNWREADLSGRAPDRVGTVQKRRNCVCSEINGGCVVVD